MQLKLKLCNEVWSPKQYSNGNINFIFNYVADVTSIFVNFVTRDHYSKLPEADSALHYLALYQKKPCEPCAHVVNISGEYQKVKRVCAVHVCILTLSCVFHVLEELSITLTYCMRNEMFAFLSMWHIGCGIFWDISGFVSIQWTFVHWGPVTFGY